MAANSKPLQKLTIDAFYDNKKKILDICGNFINDDRYPFINILTGYLNDIVSSIDVEIKNSARNSMINWREKKNPKLLSRYINNDDNINLINRSMNKITAANYKTIVAEISDSVMQDNPRRIPDYSKYLFDSVVKKCISDENFIGDYLKFLMAFEGVIAANITGFINQFIYEVVKVMTTNELFKEYIYFGFIKDVAHYKNIGVVYSNLYQISKNQASQAAQSPQSTIEIDMSSIVSSMGNQVAILANQLEWLPANIDELNGRFYLFTGILETLGMDLWSDKSISDQLCGQITDILNKAYSLAAIPNKIKFKILDLQDMIKKFKIAIPAPVPAPVPAPSPIAPITTPPVVINAWNRNMVAANINQNHDNSDGKSDNVNIVSAKNGNGSREDESHNGDVQRTSRSQHHYNRHNRDRYRNDRPERQERQERQEPRNRYKDKKEPVEVIITRGNMFAGLSSDEEKDKHKNSNQDDDFITVERKSKNKNKK